MGWLLTAGTLLSAFSMLPIFVENSPLEWIGVLGAVGGLVSLLIIRFTSPSGFLVAGAIGFLANTFFLAFLVECILRGLGYLKRRRIAHP